MKDPDVPKEPATPIDDVDTDYELMAYSHTRIDYEYIIKKDPTVLGII